MDSKLIISELLTPEQCYGRVTSADYALSESFSDVRRAEFLSWRALLSEHMGRVVEIEYDNIGAPRVVGGDVHIGVSHTTNRVAVVVSNTPCAVDIEHCDRDLQRISARFLTVQERQLAVDNPTLVAIWCSRECYYKLRHDKSLSLLTDISVSEIDMAAGSVIVTDSRGGQVTMKILEQNGYIVVYSV